ncbi:unnamed protein product [Acanthoscelides obtectus]|uniref:Arrestin C-terminal-like domain-containing protein n=1 Tax=Acanthoscelides obtectus TaxID=200917 RepID=A0A9P0PN12_ACAOB|nr:unnamed protein product [Acanthoscelides obtectus]CAK1653792.1 Phosrestin-2 [Acanthoscelides obtectus]
MGIRVVQRAFAPPSPNLYVPGGTGKTCREKAKMNKKTLLFGCKSVPVQIKNPTMENDQVISRSAETVANTETSINDKNWLHVQKTGVFADPTIFQNTTSLTVPSPTITQVRRKSILRIGDNPDEERCSSPARVSFEGKKILNGNTDEDKHSHEDNKEEKDRSGDNGIDKQDEEDRRIAEHYHSLCGSQRPSLAAFLAEVPAPKAVAEKFYMLSDGKVTLTAALDKAIYAHGEDIKVTVNIKNGSSKTVKRIKVFVVQHVDVCMFSNGKFKNVVAMMSPKEDCPVLAGTTFDKTYTMMPMKSSTKNWIALEESYNRSGTSLASTVVSVTNPDDRNVFAIYVSYYVKVKITVSLMGGELNLKLPFTLMHTCAEHELAEAVTGVADKGARPEVGGAKGVGAAEPETQDGDAETEGVIKPEKDGT